MYKILHIPSLLLVYSHPRYANFTYHEAGYDRDTTAPCKLGNFTMLFETKELAQQYLDSNYYYRIKTPAIFFSIIDDINAEGTLIIQREQFEIIEHV